MATSVAYVLTELCPKLEVTVEEVEEVLQQLRKPKTVLKRIRAMMYADTHSSQVSLLQSLQSL